MIQEKDTNQSFRKEIQSKGGNKNKAVTDLELSNIRLLKHYYDTEKLTVGRFLSALKKNRVLKIEERDIQQCLQCLDGRDPDFSRTLDLLYRAVAIPPPLAGQLINFASVACRQQLKSHYEIEIDLTNAANIILGVVVQGLKADLIGGNAHNRSFNLLKALGIWMSYSRNLADTEIVEVLAKVFMPHKERKGRGISAVVDILFRPGTKLKTLSDLSQISKHGMAKAQLAMDSEVYQRKQTEKEYQRAQNLEGRLKEIRDELQRNRQQLESLEESLRCYRDKNQILEQQVHHDRVVSNHRKDELKGRSRVFLETKIYPFLDTALQFAELDPPRKATIVERLEMAIHEIRKEIKWLTSSD